MRSDTGAGSVLAIGLVGAVTALAMVAIPLYAVLSTRSAVAGAADAAALAAADVRVGVMGGLPCAVAADVAAANATVLTACELDGLVATVRVQRVVAGLSVSATATAGPPDD